jgi:hypothetical protein
MLPSDPEIVSRALAPTGIRFGELRFRIVSDRIAIGTVPGGCAEAA